MNTEKLFKSAILKVHPDLNSESHVSASRAKLLLMFRDNEEVLRELINSWELEELDIDDQEFSYVKEDSNKPFKFPYPFPNLEFRIGDYVMYGDMIYIIESIKKIDGKWLFSLQIKSDKTNEIIGEISVIRDNLFASVDKNFYLFRSRGAKFSYESCIEY